MKKKQYNVVKIILFFLLLLLLIGAATKVTQRKESVKKYADFMELADQIDVLFFGSSHVLNGINPAQLYAEYGITSYNMAKQGGMVTESYWTLMNALDYCSPKCVVVDVWALDRNYKYVDVMNGTESWEDRKNSVSLLHNNLDVWPLSRNKIAAVRDLIRDKEIRKEFLWDFTLYHNRWSVLGKEDFQVLTGQIESSGLLGSTPVAEYYPEVKVYQPQNSGEILPDETVCVQYLNRIIEECEVRGIQVVFTFIPMASSYEQDWQAVNTAEAIGEKHQIPFINLLPHDTQSVVDFYTDMCDDTHLNANGMRKVTSHVGAYLSGLEAVADHRGEEGYARWEEKVSSWQAEEINSLLGEKDLYLELGQIQNVNASAVIFMPGGSQAIYDPMVRRLIGQLTGGTKGIDEAAQVNGPYLLIRDGVGSKNGQIQNREFSGAIQPDTFPTALGDTTYIGLSNYAAIYADGDQENNYLNMEEHYYADVQIIILGAEGEVMAKLYYDPVWNEMKRE